MAAPSPGSLGWLTWVQSRPVEMEADGLSIGVRHHKGRAANLVVSALRESSMIWIHRSDFCGLQRRPSPCLLVLRLNQNTGPGVLSARDNLQPWKAEGKHCAMSEIGRVIMILMHVNIVSRG